MEENLPQQNEITDNQFQKLPQKKSKKFLVATILVVFGLGVGYLLFMQTGFDLGCYIGSKGPAWCKSLRIAWQRNKQPSTPSLAPTPTPMPFEEMTIPHLRRRTYESKLGEQELVSENASYQSYSTNYLSDGLKINAQLTIPKGETPRNGWPAIIFVHGYIPPTLYQTFSNYSAYVDYLARSGFVVLKIDLRGHGESEGEPGGSYYSSDYIVDVLNARAALQLSNFVNKDKIGLWGHSMAGNVLLRSLAAKPEIPAVVIWGGAVYSYEDWQKYGIQDNSYRPPVNNEQRQRKRDQLFATHGQFSGTSIFWRQVAATNYLTDIQGAIQLNHAIDDDVVNVGYSRDLSQLLKKANITYQLLEYPSGGHNISGASFTKAMENTVSFFEKYLQ